MKVLAPKSTVLARNEVTSALKRQLLEIAQAPVFEVRVTPVWSTRDGAPRLIWTVQALNARRHEMPLPAGGMVRVVSLLKGFFPLAAWDVPQDYNVTTGVLSEHIRVQPACLRGAS